MRTLSPKQICDDRICLPKTSSFAVINSGLVGETLIDITPPIPIPPHVAGPHDKECKEEGAIVCHRDIVAGYIGPSTDEMVRLWVMIGRKQKRLQAEFNAKHGT